MITSKLEPVVTFEQYDRAKLSLTMAALPVLMESAMADLKANPGGPPPDWLTLTCNVNFIVELQLQAIFGDRLTIRPEARVNLVEEATKPNGRNE